MDRLTFVNVGTKFSFLQDFMLCFDLSFIRFYLFIITHYCNNVLPMLLFDNLKLLLRAYNFIANNDFYLVFGVVKVDK